MKAAFPSTLALFIDKIDAGTMVDRMGARERSIGNATPLHGPNGRHIVGSEFRTTHAGTKRSVIERLRKPTDLFPVVRYGSRGRPGGREVQR